MGRGKKRKGKKKKVKGLDGTRFVQGKGREGKGTTRESVCEQAAATHADEAGIGKVSQSQCSPLWREGLFSRGRMRGIGIAITTAQEARRARKSVQSPQRDRPREGREETKGDASAPSNFGSRTLLPHGGRAGAL